MTLPVYLAMTSLEYSRCPTPPPDICWMACQFSSYSKGLTNIPDELSENALLMLNDQFPPNGHDPALITQQLLKAVQLLRPKGIILDMQRPHCEQIQALTDHLQAALPCPVATTPAYASNRDCPIFIPPIPPNLTAENYLKQWQGREIWLELDKSGIAIELTEQGCKVTPVYEDLTEPIFQDLDLHCHYRTAVFDKKAVFTLSRKNEDTSALLLEAQKYGVTLAVGLYQEMNGQFYLSAD